MVQVRGPLSVQALNDFKKFSGQSDVVIYNRIAALKSICKKLDRLNEKDCNEGLKPEDETEERRLVKEATELAGELGCKLHHQGDPRGPAIRLVRPDGRSNGMDGETWYLP